MNEIEKMAQKDAYAWGLAEMFFGEGAGNRRKLIRAMVDQRMHDIPGYAEAFSYATERLDQVEMAEKAVALRKQIDRADKARKNLQAIKSGRSQNLSTGVFIVVGLAYFAHQVGYDEKIKAEAKRLAAKAVLEIKFRKAKMQGRNIEKLVS